MPAANKSPFGIEALKFKSKYRNSSLPDSKVFMVPERTRYRHTSMWNDNKMKCWNWLNSNFVKDSAGSLCFLCYVNLFILLRSIPQHDNGISSKPHVMSECLNSALNSASSFCFCASYASIHRTGLRRFSFTWVACGNLKSLSGSNTSYTTVVMVQISLKS